MQRASDAVSVAQYAAFKEGYSFNTLLKGADLRDSLHVKRSGNVIKVAGGKTTAVVGMNGSKVCMVSRLLFAPFFPASKSVSPCNVWTEITLLGFGLGFGGLPGEQCLPTGSLHNL